MTRRALRNVLFLELILEDCDDEEHIEMNQLIYTPNWRETIFTTITNIQLYEHFRMSLSSFDSISTILYDASEDILKHEFDLKLLFFCLISHIIPHLDIYWNFLDCLMLLFGENWGYFLSFSLIYVPDLSGCQPTWNIIHLARIFLIMEM